jgi:hypothetical protein
VVPVMPSPNAKSPAAAGRTFHIAMEQANVSRSAKMQRNEVAGSAGRAGRSDV